MNLPSSSQNSADSKTRNWKYRPSPKCVLCGDKQNRCAGRKFYTFPKDPELSEKWAAVTQKKWILSESPIRRSARFRVCANHFAQKDFKGALKSRLVPTAVPTFNKPGVINIGGLKATLSQKLNGTPPNDSLGDKSVTEDNSISIRPTVIRVAGITKNPSNAIKTTSENISGQNAISRTSNSCYSCPSKTLKVKQLSAKLHNLRRKYENGLSQMPLKRTLNFVKGFVSPAAYSFIEPQLKYSQYDSENKKSKYGQRWSENLKGFAMQLYKISPKAYRFLSKDFCLPTKKTILKCLKENKSTYKPFSSHGENESSSKTQEASESQAVCESQEISEESRNLGSLEVSRNLGSLEVSENLEIQEMSENLEIQEVSVNLVSQEVSRNLESLEVSENLGSQEVSRNLGSLEVSEGSQEISVYLESMEVSENLGCQEASGNLERVEILGNIEQVEVLGKLESQEMLENLANLKMSGSFILSQDMSGNFILSQKILT